MSCKTGRNVTYWVKWNDNSFLEVVSCCDLINAADSNFYEALTQLCLRFQLFHLYACQNISSYYFTFIFTISMSFGNK